jgi:hypothetical protein
MRKRIFRVANPVVGPAATAVVGGLLGGTAAESLAPAIGQFVGQTAEEMVKDTSPQLSLQDYTNIIDKLSAVIPSVAGNSKQLKEILAQQGFFANEQQAILTLNTLYKFIIASRNFVPEKDTPDVALRFMIELYRSSNNYQLVNDNLNNLTENSRHFGNNVYTILLSGDSTLSLEQRQKMSDVSQLLTIAQNLGRPVDSNTLNSLERIQQNNVQFFGPKSKDFMNFSILRDKASVRAVTDLERSLSTFNVLMPLTLQSEEQARQLSQAVKEFADSDLGYMITQNSAIRALFTTFVGLGKLKDSVSLGKALEEARGGGFK